MTDIQLRFNNCNSYDRITWAYRRIEHWIAQYDPKIGAVCDWVEGNKFLTAKRTKTGVTIGYAEVTLPTPPKGGGVK